MRRLMLSVNAMAGAVALSLAALLAPSALAGDWGPFLVCVGTAAITATTVAWHASAPAAAGRGCGQRA